MLGVESAMTGEKGKAAIMTSDKGADDATIEVQPTENQTAEPQASPGINEPGAAVSSAPAADAKTEGATTSEPFTPNFKFKVYDKEHEIDEIYRPLIKDKETEKRVRELHEKAYGIDGIKQDRETLRSSLTEANEKISRTDKALESLGGYVQKKDYDSFFDALKINKRDIIEYAIQVAKREQDPQAMQAYESERQARLHRESLDATQSQVFAEQQRLASERRGFELSQVLTTPEVGQFAQAYETRIGKPGAFREFVIQIGRSFEAQQQDLTAAQAVEKAIEYLQGSPIVAGATAQPQATAAPQVVQASAKPVIPNIQGRGTSPVKPSYNSLEDLKRRGKELEAQGA